MDNDKFFNLALRICERSAEPPKTKRLAKLMWLLDKSAFLKLGHKITGCEYLRKQFGPVPKNNKDLLCIMRDRGMLDIRRSHQDQMPEVSYIAQKPANMTSFTEEERKLIDEVLDTALERSTTSLVRESHDLTWALTEDNEPIRFESYLSQLPLSAELKRKFKELVEEAEDEYEDG